MKIAEITIFKQANGVGSDGEWSNTYTVSGPDNLYGDDWTGAVAGLVTAEKKFHLDFVNFTRATIRNVVKGSSKQDPLNSRAIGLNGVGQAISGPANGGLVHVAPPELCVVGAFSGGGVRFSRMLYRCCLGTDEWLNNGHGVIVQVAKSDLITAALHDVVRDTNASAGFKMLVGGKAPALNRPIVDASYGGVENRQLTQQRTGKGKFNSTDGGDVLDLVKKLTGIASDVATVVATRYDPETAVVLNLPPTKAALRALASAADNAIKAIDGNDYGDHPALPPAGG